MSNRVLERWFDRLFLSGREREGGGTLVWKWEWREEQAYRSMSHKRTSWKEKKRKKKFVRFRASEASVDWTTRETFVCVPCESQLERNERERERVRKRT